MRFHSDRWEPGSRTSSACAATKHNLPQHMYHLESWIATVKLPSLHASPKVWTGSEEEEASCWCVLRLSGLFSHISRLFYQIIHIDTSPSPPPPSPPPPFISVPFFISNCFQHPSNRRPVITVDRCHVPRLFITCVRLTAAQTISTSDCLITAMENPTENLHSFFYSNKFRTVKMHLFPSSQVRYR